MIKGVKITSLRRFADEHVKVVHAVMPGAPPFFQQFGKIYFSCVCPSTIVAWSRSKGNGTEVTVAANYATSSHSPNEIYHCDPFYAWTPYGRVLNHR